MNNFFSDQKWIKTYEEAFDMWATIYSLVRWSNYIHLHCNCDCDWVQCLIAQYSEKTTKGSSTLTIHSIGESTKFINASNLSTILQSIRLSQKWVLWIECSTTWKPNHWKKVDCSIKNITQRYLKFWNFIDTCFERGLDKLRLLVVIYPFIPFKNRHLVWR